MVPVSSPTVHSATLCGFKLPRAGLSTTVLQSTTCRKQALEPTGSRGEAGRLTRAVIAAHLDDQVVAVRVGSQLLDFTPHGGSLGGHRGHRCD